MTDTRSGPVDALAVETIRMPPAAPGGPAAPATVTGPVVRRLLTDVLPRHGRVLLAGPHASDVVALVAGRSAHVTVLVAGPDEAAPVARAGAAYAGSVDVLVGSLDELDGSGPFDAILALEGLERVPVGTPGTWTHHLDALLRHGAGTPVVVVGCPNAFSLPGLLDARPAAARSASAPARTTFPQSGSDGAAPASPADLVARLLLPGLAPGVGYAAFGNPPHTLVDTAAATPPGELAARLVTRAVTAEADGMPLLTPIGEAAAAAADAGLLTALPRRWLAVLGARGRTLYAPGGSPELVVAADPDPTGGWLLDAVAEPVPPDLAVTPPRQDADLAVTPPRQDADLAEIAPRRHGVNLTDGRPPRHDADLADVALRCDAALVPARLPAGETVERSLRREVRAGDITAARVLAAEVGAWVRGHCGTHPGALVCLDDLVPDAAGLVPGVLGWVWSEPIGAGEVLAAAWYRWHERLADSGSPHPWPPWMSADDLVALWLDAAGEPPEPEILAQGRRIAAWLRAADGVPAAPVDLRTALAAAADVRARTTELAGHVAALERTLHLRDIQLQVREDRIREQRAELRRIRNSRSFRLVHGIQRLARLLRSPRRLAAAVARRLRLR